MATIVGMNDLLLYNLLDKWTFADPAASEVTFRNLLNETGNAAFRAMIQTQLARALGLQRRFDEAHLILDETNSSVSLRMAAMVQIERGRLFNSAGNRSEAVSWFQQAYKTAQTAAEEYLAVDSLHMLAIADEPVRQVEWSEMAMKFAEGSKDERVRKWLGPLYNNLGWIYHDAGNYDRALELFNKSLEWRQQQADEKGTHIAHWCVARCLRSLGRCQEALEKQQQLAASVADDGYVFEEIGENLLLLNREEESREFFAKAYRLLSADQWMQANETVRLNRLQQLGMG